VKVLVDVNLSPTWATFLGDNGFGLFIGRPLATLALLTKS
jgi:hypothetical protein